MLKQLTYTLLLFLPFIAGCASVIDSMSEDSDYVFRKARWGYSQERVRLNEQGKVIWFNTDDVLVYKDFLGVIPVYTVYAFKKNKLRACGYITQKPVLNINDFIEKYIEKFGGSPIELTNGLLWKTPKTIMYLDGYASHRRVKNQTFTQTPGALELILNRAIEEESEIVKRWDGTLAFMDRRFYLDLAESEYPIDDLSYYEKRLLGILRRAQTLNVRTQTGTTITLPTGARIAVPEGVRIAVPEE